MRAVRIGGVPEHFNLSWYLTLKNGEYKKENINLRWKDFYGGTGAMCKALREKEIDIAVVLTEGIVKDIIAGNPSKIVQTFVKSPLIWGIHTAHDSKLNFINDLKGKKAAISRYGSGSHLMSYVLAENNKWDIKKDLQFVIVKNLAGAIEALSDKQADYFLWEKFTTKPLVDSNVFKHLGDCPTPWPCFVIAARNDFIENNYNDLKTILEIVNKTTLEFKKIPRISDFIANRYEQDVEDVLEWLSLTEWSQDIIDEETINTVQIKLNDLDLIPSIAEYSKLVNSL